MEDPDTNSPSTSSQQNLKRTASPLSQRPKRQNRTDRVTNDDVTMSTNESAEQNTGSTEPVKTAISNKLFATFKSLRKLNSKQVTAHHHLEFLTNLKEKNLVPKGLQPKPCSTGLELPPDLYEKWENAHISLGNARRDILIAYWQRQASETDKNIIEATARLNTTASATEIAHITTTLAKSRITKTEELQTRRLRKGERETAASAPGGGTAEETQD